MLLSTYLTQHISVARNKLFYKRGGDGLYKCFAFSVRLHVKIGFLGSLYKQKTKKAFIHYFFLWSEVWIWIKRIPNLLIPSPFKTISTGMGAIFPMPSLPPYVKLFCLQAGERLWCNHSSVIALPSTVPELLMCICLLCTATIRHSVLKLEKPVLEFKLL